MFLVAAGIAPGCAPPVAAARAEVACVIGLQPAPHDLILTGTDATGDGNPQARVYVHHRSRWTRYGLDDSQGIVARFRTRHRLTIIFGHHATERPGENFLGLAIDSHGNRLSCPVLDFPAALNRDERTGVANGAMKFRKSSASAEMPMG